MLIMVIGDSHITGKNPIARLDDLTETQFNKWEEIRDLANKKNTPIISVGDIFNISVVANSLVNRLGGILNTLKNPLYFVFGNHDLLYHSLSMQDRTSLGVLWQNNKNVKHISEFVNDYGISWDYQDWDQGIVKNKSEFLLTHKAIVNKTQIDSCFWIKDDTTFAKPIGQWSKKYKIILCGHWHKKYNFKDNKTIVINPGPVSRLTVEDNLQPAVCFINLNTGMFNRVELQSAKPFDEIISSKHLNTSINNTENIKNFILELGKKGSKHESTFMDNLMNIIETHALDQEMEVMLVDILSKTKERKNK